jgi:hypothetical protein
LVPIPVIGTRCKRRASSRAAARAASPADIGILVDIELHQEVVIARGGIDFGCDLGFGKRVGDRIGLAEFALDLNEERNHRKVSGRRIWPNIAARNLLATTGRARDKHMGFKKSPKLPRAPQ